MLSPQVTQHSFNIERKEQEKSNSPAKPCRGTVHQHGTDKTLPSEEWNRRGNLHLREAQKKSFPEGNLTLRGPGGHLHWTKAEFGTPRASPPVCACIEGGEGGIKTEQLQVSAKARFPCPDKNKPPSSRINYSYA